MCEIDEGCLSCLTGEDFCPALQTKKDEEGGEKDQRFGLDDYCRNYRSHYSISCVCHNDCDRDQSNE